MLAEEQYMAPNIVLTTGQMIEQLRKAMKWMLLSQ